MAADGFIGLDPDGTGKKVDMSELLVGLATVLRERMILSDNTDPLAFAAIKNGVPGLLDYGLITRIAGSVDVSGSSVIALTGGLTDAQLRLTPVPVSGTFFQATQPVSAAALPLPAGASTEATLLAIKAKTDNLDVALSTRTKPADIQAVSGPVTDGQLRATPVPVSNATLPLPTGAATEATLALVAKDATLGTVGSTELGAYTVLDRLVQIAKKLDANAKVIATEATLKLAVAALQGRPVPKPTSTLLHRS